MKANTLVNRLLETDDDFDSELDAFEPDQIKDFTLDALEYNLDAQPEEVKDILQNMPRDFVMAYFKKEYARTDISEPPEEWWIEESGDGEWYRITYYTEYETDDGRLVELIRKVDEDGNHDTLTGAEVGTEDHRRMKNEYAHYKWLENNANYYRWVAFHGRDPLGEFDAEDNLVDAAKKAYLEAEQQAKKEKVEHRKIPHYLL